MPPVCPDIERGRNGAGIEEILKEVEGNDIIQTGKASKNQIGGIRMLESDNYNMPEAKIKDFLLKPGALHAQEFFDVGYTVDDVEKLNRDIDRHFDIGFAFDKVSFPDGREKFSIFMNLGVTKQRRFRTVWQKDTPEEKPRFITAHRE